MNLGKAVSILSERTKRTFDFPYRQQLKDILIYTRYQFMKDALNKNTFDRKHFLETMKVELEKTNDITLQRCPNNTSVLKTSLKVPNPIRASNFLFDYVGSVGYSTPFTLINPIRLRSLFSEDRGPVRPIYYLYLNEYIYIINAPSKVASIIGIFPDPRKLKDIGYDDDLVELVAPDDLMRLVINEVLRVELNPNFNEDKKIDVNLE